MKKKIENKGYEFRYEIGSEVYGLKQIISNELCPRCGGRGYIGDKGTVCPLCNGNHTIIRNTSIPLYEPSVVKEQGLIVTGDKTVEIYHLEHNGKMLAEAVSAESIFATRKEAQKWCNKHNVRRDYMKMTDIEIPHAFLTTIPSPEKITKRMEEIKTNGKFTNIIEVDENGTLVDGYTTYVLAKGLGLKEIEVLVHTTEG